METIQNKTQGKKKTDFKKNEQNVSELLQL